MKRIIINADDFGINDDVTSEIERLIDAGRVRSTTVMANGASLDEVRRFASQHPEVSFGVHLCLSEFLSLTNSKVLQQAGLVGENGMFIHKAIFKSKQLMEKDVRQAICEELNAQIDKVSSLGFPISHADSHHHVHTIYPLYSIFEEVLKSRGIDKIRIGENFQHLRMKVHIVKWAQRCLLNMNYRKNFLTASAFYSYTTFHEMGFPIKDNQTIELMCHPGHPGKDFRMEIEKLVVDGLPNDIRSISYNEL